MSETFRSPALHEANVRLVQPATARNFDLCPPLLFAACAEAETDLPEESFVVEVH